MFVYNHKMGEGMQKRNVKKIRRMLLTTAIALIIVGIYQQGQWDLLNKAIRICYECIGIG